MGSTAGHPEFFMTCASCGLSYYFAGNKINVPGVGWFSEPPDALQVLALIAH